VGDHCCAIVTWATFDRVRAYGGPVTAVPTFNALADEQFVSLTTFRRDGSPVPTPVWIARDGDVLVVTTPADSGKVKRLRRDPRVDLRPCDRRGRVRDGAVPVAGTAEVLAPLPRHADALRGKYGVQYRIGTVVERLVRGRRERVILRITLATPTP
jgi:PPOX class probable F420-dependent enzyme